MADMKLETYIVDLPSGPIDSLLVTKNGEALMGVDIAKAELAEKAIVGNADDKNLQVLQQLYDYMLVAHNSWSVMLAERGTPFQRKVWHYLQGIPLGETRTYGEIASALNSSPRAVGNACRANPFLLIVPCHRAVKATGLGGFAGQIDGKAVEIKQWLLQHERQANS